MPDDARLLFADLLGDADCTAILLDGRGAQVAGSYLDASGAEAGARIGSALSGMRTEVTRAMPHLEVGEWRALVIETWDSTIAIAPGADESIVLLAASSQEPVGRVDEPGRRHMAALAAYLYSRAGRASAAAGLGNPAFMRLEADSGQLCVVGAGEVVLVTLIDSGANLGRIRLDMLAGRKIQ